MTRQQQDPSFAGKPPSFEERSSIRDNGDRPARPWWDDRQWKNTTASVALPGLRSCLKVALGTTVALYILNQKHLLPKPLSAIVSKTLFWPTLPITVVRRLGKWETVIDDTVIMGGAPFGFAGIPEKLYEQYGVRGVINMCAEYEGPILSYKRLGVRQLWLPTIDHFESSDDDLKRAVSFISEHKALGKKVYVHCRAGHGRSAAVVYAWLLTKNPDVDMKKLNEELCRKRDVRKTLWKQRNIVRFHSRLRKESISDDNNDDYGDEDREEL